jgi:K+-sensing histidine kinase KdpD
MPSRRSAPLTGRPRSADNWVVSLQRIPSVPFLLRQVRVGVVATGLTVTALAVSYFVLERAPFHRVGLAVVLGVAAVGGVAIAALPWPRLFETTGMRLLYAWSVADIVLISFAVASTGGGRSDLFLLYTLTTFFFVASYPLSAQFALLIFTAVSYTVVIILTGWQITAGALVARLSILAVLAYLAGYLSKELLDRVRSEAAARQEADERAALMSGVVRAGRDLTLDPSQVVEVTLDAVGELGFADAAFVALHEDGSVSHVVGSRGRFDGDGPVSTNPALDVVDLVVAQGETAVVEGLPDDVPDGPAIRIGSPVWVGGWMAAVLVGGTDGDRSIAPHRPEAFELLATNAGLAMENAGRYEEQRRTVERLEETERLKADFITSVSHELRTPLTSIIGNAITLEQAWSEIDDGTRLELLASLTARARELEEKITELVDISGSESATRGSFRALDLSTLVVATAEQMGDPLSSHRFVVNVRPGLVTFGDPALLSQVLRNLLENAATHTPSGTTVTLSADLEGQEEIVVAVSDDGPGISAADLPYLGAKFFRGGDLNARPKGLGLGLALATSALELHGAALEVESAEGRGSRFSFRMSRLDASGDAPVNGEVVHEGA